MFITEESRKENNELTAVRTLAVIWAVLGILDRMYKAACCHARRIRFDGRADVAGLSTSPDGLLLLRDSVKRPSSP